jgi:hypothetical protein
MSRQKRTSRILEKVELRLARLKAIDPAMDFGDARNVSTIIQLIEQLRTRLDAYNTALSMIDSSKAAIDELEKTLSDLSEKMLIGVAFKYGKDSHEYEMAGGVRKSERVRRSTTSRLKSGAEEPSSGNNQQYI